MVAQFTTIGHSNRSLDHFTRMLREAGVAMVVDVRSFPRSRANPQFNIDDLPGVLAEMQIGYLHCPALGGRRPRQPGVPDDLNAMWRLRSFHNYADYALGGRFAEALDHVLRLGRDRRLALMCSEAVWWRCHRRIITDYLLLNGHAVDHLMDLGQITPASATPGARLTPEGKVIYPQPAPGAQADAPPTDADRKSAPQ
ncbi:DUF488 family protein [Paracoccus alkenifer]|uniref:DUF488 domain-containing protein n=1 Tax=Paracoccus alkenifer TaxID=65735 RepID=A0A1H6JMB9_9RHOB|nr:DUF488 domain-containing protein [Paracoccus alkenifer]SEH63527.1 Protein of unknown function, DUF488 [Paracoccus alkenifer]